MTLLDSFAWFEYFHGTKRGERVRALLEGAGSLFTSPLVLAEITSKVTRVEGAGKAAERLAFVLAHSAVIPVDETIGIEAGQIHAHERKTKRDFGMVDAVILASARSRGVSVLTGDPHFKGLSDADLL